MNHYKTIIMSDLHLGARQSQTDKIIEFLKITIPIVFIKSNLYLIGSARVPCDLKNENVIVRVGGGI